jgi:fatty acid CoA ligase FadD9
MAQQVQRWSAGSGRDDEAERRYARLHAGDGQFRDAVPDAAVAARAVAPGLRLAQRVDVVMQGYAQRPALGQRARELVTDPDTGRTAVRLLPRFDTITYRELWERAGAVAAGWLDHPEAPLHAGDFVCALGFTGCDYVTVDLACLRLGAVFVPLHFSSSASQLAPIVAETDPRILAASIERLDTAVELALAASSVRRLIVFDYLPDVDDQRELFECALRRLRSADRPVIVDPLTLVRERASTSPDKPLYVPPADENPLALLIYTSGSTGSPKGAMYPERMVETLWTGFLNQPSDRPVINLGYRPLSHLAGRSTLIQALSSGGTCYFTADSEASTLFENLALVRPTQILLVPRVCAALFQLYCSELDRRAPSAADREAVEARLKAELNENVFGGRILSAICGAGPLSAELKAFVESVLGLNLNIGYGATETVFLTMNGRVSRPPVLAYKLTDVPELGYFSTDVPHPRGELMVRTALLVPGYYKRPGLLAQMIDEDGFYRTGDIMAEIGPDQLAFVERRSNVLKLSRGFVALSRLETALGASPMVRQIFVYGNWKRSHLLAVVVPTPSALEHSKGDATALKALLGESLRQAARDAELKPHELPRDFLIETEPFSEANGLLSDAGKLLWPRLRAHYGERLDALYADLAREQKDELHTLHFTHRDRSVPETVTRRPAS